MSIRDNISSIIENVSKFFIDTNESELFLPINGRWGQYDIDSIQGIILAGLTIERSNQHGYFINIANGWNLETDADTGVKFLYNRSERVVLTVLPRGFWEKHRLTVFWDDNLFKFKIKKLEKRPERIKQNPFTIKEP